MLGPIHDQSIMTGHFFMPWKGDDANDWMKRRTKNMKQNTNNKTTDLRRKCVWL